ncbi:hypothetical protein [Embleya sp. NBC_00896]|uniref:hypothetical protein n=1 Tax=Embleya sp. NBC_00896 TaxID=2975961 RepID=UPI002F90A979|nr:hypothetical protein OG928_48000 [Embleya sp. NBC_00896]
MLSESLTALAAAGGTTVVQAMGTDAWTTLRTGIARLFGRGDAGRGEQVALERLDRSLAEVETSADTDRTREHVALAWRTRFEDLFDALSDDERVVVETELRSLLSEAEASPGVSATGFRSAAVGGDLSISAQDGAAAAFNMGDVTLGGSPVPPAPGPTRD